MPPLLSRLLRPANALTSAVPRLAHRLSRCEACGGLTVFLSWRVLPSDLIAQWGLDPAWVRAFNQRESGYCVRCWSGLRSRHMAATLVAWYGRNSGQRVRFLADLCATPSFRALRIAEINACGQLHKALVRCPGVTYSEYRPKRPTVRREDVLALGYPDASFDLCLTSETLEHVPDVARALSEIRRVLVPGGRHIFTIPVVWDRPHGRVRAALDDWGRLRHEAPPSYHGCGRQRVDYLVFTEFGNDVVDLVRSAGFLVDVVRHPTNPAVATFVTTRSEAAHA